MDGDGGRSVRSVGRHRTGQDRPGRRPDPRILRPRRGGADRGPGVLPGAAPNGGVATRFHSGMGLPDLLVELFWQGAMDAAGAVLEWFVQRGRRLSELFRRERRAARARGSDGTTDVL